MPIEAVTFDFHNTLASCDRWFALEVRELVPETLRILARRGLAPDDAAVRDRARVAYRDLREAIVADGRERDALDGALATLAAVGVAASPEAVRLAIDDLMHEALADVRPMPGAVEAVEALRRRRVRLGVVSSAVFHPFLEWTLDRFGLRDRFACVVSSASSGWYKSRPEIYQSALRQLGVAPARTVHVGDSYRYDVEGARRAGLRTIWYASTLEVLERETVVADATVGDLATLPQVIATLDEESLRA